MYTVGAIIYDLKVICPRGQIARKRIAGPSKFSRSIKPAVVSR